MALTDLTGTKWIFNEEVNASPYWPVFDVDFNSNNVNYTFIAFDEDNDGEDETYFRMYYGVDKVYHTWQGGWTDQAYRLIEITGGTDATNANLISFIQSNAEQIIDNPVLPSFSDVEVTPHDGYITMTINGVDFNLKTAASVSLISFSISNNITVTYQAEDGMTWAEWVASDYNTDGFVVDTGRILIAGNPVTYGSGAYVSPSDTIQSGYAYATGGGGAN